MGSFVKYLTKAPTCEVNISSIIGIPIIRLIFCVIDEGSRRMGRVCVRMQLGNGACVSFTSVVSVLQGGAARCELQHLNDVQGDIYTHTMRPVTTKHM